ncbi:ATP-dependent DNA helicase [Plakobranchus ocellatus]|uniref:ATP-dependent DNA helicase n=1 Tax=Plakobranchus ocellatus TaxID=259542 RepID=A0AAV4A3S5_9GAST|nr:ATP-dependent DNA helicase [Plakobranchus ocellatus]
MSIHGTLHQGALVFTNRGRQCISNSVAALVYHLNKSISTWETHDLDHILDQGDNLHSILFGHLNEDYPLVNSLPKQLTVYDYQVDLQMTNSFTGLLEAMNDDPPYFSIETAVSNVNNFAILNLGSCKPAFSSTIVKEDIYYIFDPHSRDSAGMASPDGTTVRTSHVSVAEVKQYLLSLATSLGLSSCPFELTLVDLQVKTLEPVYHNLQPNVPSRFEESSDSDVPLASIQKQSKGLDQVFSQSDSDNLPLVEIQRKSYVRTKMRRKVLATSWASSSDQSDWNSDKDPDYVLRMSSHLMMTGCPHRR